MKLFLSKEKLSKEKLFAAVQPDESMLAELDVPTSGARQSLVFPGADAPRTRNAGALRQHPFRGAGLA